MSQPALASSSPALPPAANCGAIQVVKGLSRGAAHAIPAKQQLAMNVPGRCVKDTGTKLMSKPIIPAAKFNITRTTRRDPF
jgi:hypothetical protein